MKKLSILFMTGVLIASLSACGGGGTSPATPSSSSSSSESTDSDAASSSGAISTDTSAELSYVSWNANQEDQNRATIAAFNEIYPNIKINLSYSTWNEYWNKLEAAASAGQLPDLVTMHTNTIEMYVNNDFMADLSDLDKIDPNFSYDAHPEDVKKLYRFKDKMWGVPKDFDCIVLIYNKELFDAKNLEYPTDEWTWDDLETAAAALTDKNAGVYGFGARNDQQAGWASFLYQAGGGILSDDGEKSALDEPGSIKAMEWWLHMYENYAPQQSTYAESDPQTIFSSGIVAMQTIGNWDLNYYTDNEEIAGKWDIVALPHPSDGQKATIMNGLALSVSAKSKNLDAAKQFAAYFGTKQGQLDAAMGPSVPCYEGVSDTWAEMNKDQFNVNAVLSQMEFGKQWIGTESKTQWNAAMETEIATIYNDGVDVETALKAAAEKMNAILDQQ